MSNPLKFVRECTVNYFRAINSPICKLGPYSICRSGFRSPLQNVVVASSEEKREPAIVQSVDRITTIFIKSKLPHTWWVENSRETQALQHILIKRKFRPLGADRPDNFPGMIVEVENSDFRPHTKLSITQVTTEENFLKWSTIRCSTYNFSPEEITRYAQIFRNYHFQGRFDHFWGEAYGEPVCSGSVLYGLHGSAFIYNVVTLPNARKKGYATDLSKKLLESARRNRYNQVALISSPAAQKPYRSLGFKELCHYRIYVAPGATTVFQ